jgi:hypothetical protein
MIFLGGGEVDVNANLARVIVTARVVTTEEVITRGRLRASSCLKKLLRVVDIAICEREDMGGVSGEKRCWKWMFRGCSKVEIRSQKRRQIT